MCGGDDLSVGLDGERQFFQLMVNFGVFVRAHV